MIDFVVNTAGRYADAATYAALAERAGRRRTTRSATASAAPDPGAGSGAGGEARCNMAVSPSTPPTWSHHHRAGVGREHPDQAWEFAVAHRDALMKTQPTPSAATARFPASSPDRPTARHADMMEEYIARTSARCAGRSAAGRQRHPRARRAKGAPAAAGARALLSSARILQ
jgi:hypothetical protein